MNIREIFTPLNIVLILLLVATTIAGFILIPAGTLLPVHWGISGEPDNFLPREWALLLLPAIALGTMAILVFAAQSGARERAGAKHAIGALIPAFLGLFLAITIATVMIGTGMEVDMVRIVVIGVGVLFAVLGNVLPKTQPNAVAGIRLPWTLNDPRNWQATHRLGGVLTLVGGVVIVVAALLTAHPVTLLIVLGLGVLLPLVATILYSYRLSHRSQD